jgi:hypothetical protein
MELTYLFLALAVGVGAAFIINVVHDRMKNKKTGVV